MMLWSGLGQGGQPASKRRGGPLPSPQMQPQHQGRAEPRAEQLSMQRSLVSAAVHIRTEWQGLGLSMSALRARLPMISRPEASEGTELDCTNIMRLAADLIPARHKCFLLHRGWALRALQAGSLHVCGHEAAQLSARCVIKTRSDKWTWSDSPLWKIVSFCTS